MTAKLTQETILNQFNDVHGDTYDYSKVVYKGVDTKVEIGCKQGHPSFLQTPYDHRKGNGCPKCGNIKAALSKGFIPAVHKPPKQDGRAKRKLTTEDVVAKFKAIHGDKYDYSRVNYIESKQPVLIGCEHHGFVEVSTFKHVNTDGCPECGKLKKKPPISFQAFKAKATVVHGDKYRYYEGSFTQMQGLVKIHCREHDDFWQQASAHVQGRGCPSCALVIMGDTHKDTQEEFIEKAIAKHGDTLDFSAVEYLRYDVPVDVICTVHNKSFQIKPNVLLKGQACPICASEEFSRRSRHSKEQFVEKANNVHGVGKYDYTLVAYETSKKNVTIICPVGHVFQQTPHNHTAGKHGCPSCGPCGFDARKDSWIYVLSAEGMSKVGITNRSAKIRAKSISKSAGFEFKVEAEYKLDGQFCSDLESDLLRQYRLCYSNPTPAFQGSSECFVGLSVETIESDITRGIEQYEDKNSLRPRLGNTQDILELQE